ncbi:MAG: electron transfer flavoprotein subunit alpha/FixB family protein [Proteobacteria bacterium]|nr:electron transfer flavoprotein subunit alpha/FixB family protein [Pseudomonadota bacterium]MBU4469850.1 electron transfer flavoprotein subunit alpha/FixB family protein [Pseudomonadota bacterium]MCG2753085.1 electron transfer flavoprotein subunit alpha/FixB family protein [Desulfobacteraceae bacterium]
MAVDKNVMVFIEFDGDRIADVSLELVCEAKRLADQLHVEVEGVAMGFEKQHLLPLLGQYGCSRVYYTNDKRLVCFSSVPYAEVVAQTLTRYHPQIVLFGATTMGRDIAPRVASKLKCGLTADCTQLKIGSHKIKDKEFDNILLQIRPAFGGNIIATIVSPESMPSMATVRDGVMKMVDPDTLGDVAIVEEKCDVPDLCFLTEVLEAVREEKAVDLKQARIIVSAGMGASDPEGIALVKALADVLGGVVGSSRPVADAGVLDRCRQVGQTGVTVRPNLYIACGISGQIQHRAGMEGAKRIIAINQDPEAPIFSIAHYGIVGDIHEVIPRMIKAYKAKS